MSYINTSGALLDMTNETAKMQAEKASRNTGNSDLGQDAFLQLLMAQMKNQDPLNPTDSSQFMSQQAQFTQISELQKLNKAVSSNNSIMQASSLIGKEVSLADPNSSDKTITGIVTEAVCDSKGANVVVDGTKYPLDLVFSIKNANTGT